MIRRVSNFDQLFEGLPISLYQRPHPTSVVHSLRAESLLLEGFTKDHREQPMTSLNPRADIYDPKTLAAMDQAFAAVWHMLRAREYANDTELRAAIGKKLLNLVADGVTDPLRLRNLTVESLLLTRH
jgi:hypothetical protein